MQVLFDFYIVKIYFYSSRNRSGTKVRLTIGEEQNTPDSSVYISF